MIYLSNKQEYIYFLSVLYTCIHTINADVDLAQKLKYRQGLIGGFPSSITKHPYLVSFTHKRDTIGAGAIIRKKWILTSANCVFLFEPKDLVVRAGSEYAQKEGQALKVKQICIHPDNDGSWRNDVALVELEEEIQLGKLAATIKIPDTIPRINDTLTTVSGWGYANDEAMNLTVVDDIYPILDYDSCKYIFEHPDRRGLSIMSFCTFKKGHVPCMNDEGNPLVYKNELIGLYSGTVECVDAEHPAVYIGLDNYKNWINELLKNNSVPDTRK